MRTASDGAEARGRRGDKAAVPVPPFEGEPGKLFGFGVPKRKKKEGVTLRTALAASGTAAALAVTGAGAVLLINAESAPSGDHGGDRFGVAPTAVADNEPPATPPAAAAAGAPTQAPAGAQMAVALTPPPGQVEGAKAPSPPSAPAAISTPGGPAATGAASSTTPAAVRLLYSSAVRLIESGDLAGVNDLKKAANLGHPPAQFYLAKLYETGGAGLTKDLVEARRWTERAAENGDVSAMHNLGLYYYEGEAGAQDPAKAAQWFQRAANLGVKDSQYNLAMLYAKGYGVPKNTSEAYKWYLVAAAAGDQGAKDAAQALRPQLTPDSQAAAERAAAAFHVQAQIAAIRTASAHP
jgi:localization factor PodJL